MKINPIFQFDSVIDTGINLVPEGSMVMVHDIDGNGNPAQFIKKSLGSLDVNSTIADMMADTNTHASMDSGDINGGIY